MPPNRRSKLLLHLCHEHSFLPKSKTGMSSMLCVCVWVCRGSSLPVHQPAAAPAWALVGTMCATQLWRSSPMLPASSRHPVPPMLLPSLQPPPHALTLSSRPSTLRNAGCGGQAHAVAFLWLAGGSLALPLPCLPCAPSDTVSCGGCCCILSSLQRGARQLQL